MNEPRPVIKVVTETITCDICGRESSDATTVMLGWGKEQWELDLCEKDSSSVSRTFDSWIKWTEGQRPKVRTGSPAAGGDVAAIREWASANGLNVAAKGRISAEVRQAYTSAQKK